MKAIDHINRYVSNVEKFVYFYQDVLGYKLIGTGLKANGKSYAILKGAEHELFISEKEDYVEEKESNFKHIGYNVENADELLVTLKLKGYVEVNTEIIIKSLSRQFYIKDPDGFEIDLIQWTDKQGFYNNLKNRCNGGGAVMPKVNSTVEEIKNSIGYCGLVCKLCHLADTCDGCKTENNCCGRHLSAEGCYQFNCCVDRGLDGCWECKDFFCEKDMFSDSHDIRLRAFVRCAKEEGVDKLAEYVFKNQQNGIYYGHQKDYDNLGNEETVLKLLRTGQK